MDQEELLQERIYKQTYLRTEILESNVDSFAFQKKMIAAKKNGDNIDHWTLDELKAVVNEFKNNYKAHEVSAHLRGSLHPTHSRHLTETNKNIEKIAELDLGVECKKLQSQEAEGNEPDSDDYYENYLEFLRKKSEEPDRMSIIPQNQEILESQYINKPSDSQDNGSIIYMNTKALDPLVSPIKGIEIRVDEGIKVQGGILSFGRSYYKYSIKTLPYGWSVARRFSDFEWLRKTIIRLYPGMLIAPLINEKEINQQFITMDTVINFLSKFLNNLAENYDVFFHDAMITFLRDDEETFSFSKKRIDGDPTPNPEKIEDFFTLSGSFAGCIKKDIQVFSNEINHYLKSSGTVHSKLIEQVKRAMIDFDNLSDTIHDIGSNFDNLHQICKEFHRKVPIAANTRMEEIFMSMNKLFISWGNCMRKQSPLLHENLFRTLNYSVKEFEECINILNTRNIYQYNFTKENLKLLKKKDQLFDIKNIEKWEISPEILADISQQVEQEMLENKEKAALFMCTAQTDNLAYSKSVYAYYNQRMFQGITECLGHQAQSFIENVKEMTKQHKNSFNELTRVWTETIISGIENSNIYGLNDSQPIYKMPTLRKTLRMS